MWGGMGKREERAGGGSKCGDRGKGREGVVSGEKVARRGGEKTCLCSQRYEEYTELWMAVFVCKVTEELIQV